MICRPYEEAKYLTIGSDVQYLDQNTYEPIDAKVVYMEQVGENVIFAYLASSDNTENNKSDFGVKYKDIMVFDTLPNEMPDGSYRDPIYGEHGKLVGRG